MVLETRWMETGDTQTRVMAHIVQKIERDGAECTRMDTQKNFGRKRILPSARETRGMTPRKLEKRVIVSRVKDVWS